MGNYFTSNKTSEPLQVSSNDVVSASTATATSTSIPEEIVKEIKEFFEDPSNNVVHAEEVLNEIATAAIATENVIKDATGVIEEAEAVVTAVEEIVAPASEPDATPVQEDNTPESQPPNKKHKKKKHTKTH